MKKKPIVLCIMDGYAITSRTFGNAIFSAKKPNLDYIFAHYPNILLQASGLAVGLPDNQIGNSEVGHMNIGAGRVVYQSLTYVNEKLRNNEFKDNAAFHHAFDFCLENDSSLHIIGLLSDGGVHSHIDHMIALLDLAKDGSVKKVFLHVFLDGRDVEPQSGYEFVRQLQSHIEKIQYGNIASISGRYYPMDRDKNFERFQLGYQSMVERVGPSFSDPLYYIKKDYQRQMDKKGTASDEFVLPGFNQLVEGNIKDNDSIIFANFRPDRAIQLATILTNPTFYKKFGYVPETKLNNIFLVTMMHYADSVIAEVAYKLDELNQPLGVYLAENGFNQLRIAETEKYAHVTFFFDGTINYDGVSKVELDGCERVLIPSPKVATYDLKPEMSAYEITSRLMSELDRDYFDVVILNFANCDMVGHTAVFDATIKAVETVDDCVGQIYRYLQKNGGTLFITADHGNADCLIDDNHNLVTAHTTNPVPLIICDNNYEFVTPLGKLGDIAPTLLSMMELSIPKEMTGRVLIRRKRATIETERLLLRNFNESDLADFHEYCKEPGVGEAAGWPHHCSLNESKIILETFLTKSSEYAVVLKETNKLIGSLGIMQGDHKEGDKEIGYVLHKNYWGKGLMSEAVEGAIQHFFQQMKGNTLWVSHHLGNQRSQRVIEKTGFRFIKENRRELRLLNEVRDGREYKITKRDYLKKFKHE